MLRAIQTHTNREARKIDPKFSLTMEQLEAFIALQYTRGIYGKHHSVHFLWKKTYGQSIFRDTTARDCFLEIKKFIRFDSKNRRRQRLTEDKFVHIREQLESFVTNCLFIFTSDWSLTIDEQLFPMKNRCPFIVYMPNKPDKFGMKVWMLTEVDSKYVYNIFPYLGALEREQRDGRPLAEDVVIRLAQSIHKQGGYNVTTDNFFTSVNLATLLLKKKISMVLRYSFLQQEQDRRRRCRPNVAAIFHSHG